MHHDNVDDNDDNSPLNIDISMGTIWVEDIHEQYIVFISNLTLSSVITTHFFALHTDK